VHFREPCKLCRKQFCNGLVAKFKQPLSAKPWMTSSNKP